MSDIAIAADQVRVMVNQHRALVAVGEVLDNIVSLEQQRHEAEEAAVAARALRDAAIGEGDVARENAQLALEEVSESLRSAREELATTRALIQEQQRAASLERADLARRQADVENAEARVAEAKRQMSVMLA